MRAAKSLPEVHNATVPTVWPIFNILCYEPTYYIDALHLYVYLPRKWFDCRHPTRDFLPKYKGGLKLHSNYFYSLKIIFLFFSHKGFEKAFWH